MAVCSCFGDIVALWLYYSFCTRVISLFPLSLRSRATPVEETSGSNVVDGVVANRKVRAVTVWECFVMSILYGRRKVIFRMVVFLLLLWLRYMAGLYRL